MKKCSISLVIRDTQKCYGVCGATETHTAGRNANEYSQKEKD